MAEREGVRQDHVPTNNTKSWCGRCGDKCTQCTKRYAKQDMVTGETPQEAGGGPHKVCVHCSKKRICEGCGEERDLAEFDHKRVEKQRCKICTGATPRQDSARDLEKCHHCPETFFREAWTQVERNNIRMKRKRVICDTCQETGLTPRDGEIYICGGAGCETKGGVGKFDAAAFASWSRKSRRGVLLCRTCAPGRTLTAPQKRKTL